MVEIPEEHAKHLSLLHNKYAIVSADKAPNNIVCVCKSHYIKELGVDNSLGNPTYTPTTPTKEEILDNYRSVLCSSGISTIYEELDLLRNSCEKSREVKCFNDIAGRERPRLYIL
jgi:hypothetical protein